MIPLHAPAVGHVHRLLAGYTAPCVTIIAVTVTVASAATPRSSAIVMIIIASGAFLADACPAPAACAAAARTTATVTIAGAWLPVRGRYSEAHALPAASVGYGAYRTGASTIVSPALWASTVAVS